jgi:hypothetical protein
MFLPDYLPAAILVCLGGAVSMPLVTSTTAAHRAVHDGDTSADE